MQVKTNQTIPRVFILAVIEPSATGQQERIVPNPRRSGPQCWSRFETKGAALTVCALLWLIATPALAQDFEAGTFVMRNYSPLSAIVGVPGRWPDGTSTIAELSLNISNHSLAEAGYSDSQRLDGETHTLTARLQHRFFKRYQSGIEIPWI
jgi:hypothetical protein